MNMKKTLLILLVASVSFASQSIAQETTQKLGHLSITKVLETMPKYKEAEKKLQEFAVQLQQTMGSMEQEYTKKVQEYYEQEEQMLPAIAEVKQKEIVDLENRIKKLQVSSEKQLMDKQVELLTPLEAEVMGAISSVAKDKGYSYIFDSSVGSSLLYYPDTEDVTSLIKAKLGVQ